MIILPVGVLSFVCGWDLGWEGFGIVWCLLKRPSIALLLDNCKTSYIHNDSSKQIVQFRLLCQKNEKR